MLEEARLLHQGVSGPPAWMLEEASDRKGLIASVQHTCLVSVVYECLLMSFTKQRDALYD